VIFGVSFFLWTRLFERCVFGRQIFGSNFRCEEVPDGEISEFSKFEGRFFLILFEGFSVIAFLKILRLCIGMLNDPGAEA